MGLALWVWAHDAGPFLYISEVVALELLSGPTLGAIDALLVSQFQ